MPYLPTAQEWLTQSALLLEARPRTTRITTKYTLSKPVIEPRTPKPSKADPTKTTSTTAEAPSTAPDPAPASTNTTTTTATPAATTAPPPLPTTRAVLTLKTYNPTSGVTLKYKTDKAAEVGRLVSSLARLGRTMAGLPEVKGEDAVMVDVSAAKVEGAGDGLEAGATGILAPVPEKVGTASGGGQLGGQQGGKKGKKKGKK